MTAIDERALAAAFDILWPAQEWNGEERVCRAATRATITAYLQALRPGSTGDWVLVPKEPTDIMIRAAFQEYPDALEWRGWERAYSAMIRAMLAAAGENE